MTAKDIPCTADRRIKLMDFKLVGTFGGKSNQTVGVVDETVFGHNTRSIGSKRSYS